ncbi:hypothetical protein Q9233_017392 [Columba guinea]|nr:hypothetical protein Q9233_017392 [Columba guinea]
MALMSHTFVLKRKEMPPTAKVPPAERQPCSLGLRLAKVLLLDVVLALMKPEDPHCSSGDSGAKVTRRRTLEISAGRKKKSSEGVCVMLDRSEPRNRSLSICACRREDGGDAGRREEQKKDPVQQIVELPLCLQLGGEVQIWNEQLLEIIVVASVDGNEFPLNQPGLEGSRVLMEPEIWGQRMRKLIQHKESCKFVLYYDLKHLAENSSLNSTTCLLAAEEMVTMVF